MKGELWRWKCPKEGCDGGTMLDSPSRYRGHVSSRTKARHHGRTHLKNVHDERRTEPIIEKVV